MGKMKFEGGAEMIFSAAKKKTPSAGVSVFISVFLF
jgi:hypothetical protein